MSASLRAWGSCRGGMVPRLHDRSQIRYPAKTLTPSPPPSPPRSWSRSSSSRQGMEPSAPSPPMKSTETRSLSWRARSLWVRLRPHFSSVGRGAGAPLGLSRSNDRRCDLVMSAPVSATGLPSVQDSAVSFFGYERARGRMMFRLEACSIAWAVQPVIRPIAKMAKAASSGRAWASLNAASAQSTLGARPKRFPNRVTAMWIEPLRGSLSRIRRARGSPSG